jgi:hypothetical protein
MFTYSLLYKERKLQKQIKKANKKAKRAGGGRHNFCCNYNKKSTSLFFLSLRTQNFNKRGV